MGPPDISRAKADMSQSMTSAGLPAPSPRSEGAGESPYELLTAAAAQWPDHTAIELLDRRLTYAEFDTQSRRLAGFLTVQGAGPGCRIGFCFDKSVEALVSLFAIIRTGATYVPLDPKLPAARMIAICQHCGIRAMVCGKPHPDVTGLDWVVAVDPAGAESASTTVFTYEEALARGPTACGPAPAPADGVANILYTSGSTGEPKGVMITTRSLLHFARWGVRTFGITPTDRLSNHAPYSFDLSTFDIFAAVCAGATQCPVPESARSYPYRLARFIASSRITIWYSVPWSLVLMALRGGLKDHDLSLLRHVLFAGEVMPPEHLRRMMELVPQATYWNLYGPTETNVCLYHRVEPRDLDRPEGIPIGRPIDDTTSWVLDSNGHSIQAPEAGELVVRGPTLFAGYFNSPSETADRLMPAPDGVGQAYRTGDRVALLADGELGFMGRCDRMVKSRGYRIELSEVEAALVSHPAVTEAAVVSVPDTVLSNALVAFIALQEGTQIGVGDIRSHIREHLPQYMVPAHWRFVERLPRNSNGKIDLTAMIKAFRSDKT